VCVCVCVCLCVRMCVCLCVCVCVCWGGGGGRCEFGGEMSECMKKERQCAAAASLSSAWTVCHSFDHELEELPVDMFAMQAILTVGGSLQPLRATRLGLTTRVLRPAISWHRRLWWPPPPLPPPPHHHRHCHRRRRCRSHCPFPRAPPGLLTHSAGARIRICDCLLSRRTCMYYTCTYVRLPPTFVRTTW
jgi:hypothetical protein